MASALFLMPLSGGAAGGLGEQHGAQLSDLSRQRLRNLHLTRWLKPLLCDRRHRCCHPTATPLLAALPTPFPLQLDAACRLNKHATALADKEYEMNARGAWWDLCE